MINSLNDSINSYGGSYAIFRGFNKREFKPAFSESKKCVKNFAQCDLAL